MTITEAVNFCETHNCDECPAIEKRTEHQKKVLHYPCCWNLTDGEEKQMKLIDADLLEDKVDVADANDNGIHEVLEYVRYSHIEDAPTVEAIPVSFIKEQIKQTGDYEESWNYQALIDKWRNQNE